MLCLPLFLFSQEERQYEKEISFSQFAQELKEAAENNIGYTLNNCKITFNKDSDRKYFKDSFTLSINAFSTLGFGQIPVGGFTKYVAIIEGFIGWFLLSIFLVSVLSQMMSV